MKTIGELRDALRNSEANAHGEAEEFALLHVVLDNVLEYIDSLNGRVELATQEHVVPAQWYRSAVHNHMKAYIELLALAAAVRNHSMNGQFILEAQKRTLSDDPEYQRLLAEETPTLVHDQPVWGKGIEDLVEMQRGHFPPGALSTVVPNPEDQSLLSCCLVKSPDGKAACGFTKDHTGVHGWELPCPQICKCKDLHPCLHESGHECGHLFDCDTF